jgi:hypothetical protein
MSARKKLIIDTDPGVGEPASQQNWYREIPRTESCCIVVGTPRPLLPASVASPRAQTISCRHKVQILGAPFKAHTELNFLKEEGPLFGGLSKEVEEFLY